MTFAERVISFNTYLSKVDISLPHDYAIKNQFLGEAAINNACSFYREYYNDNNQRTLILGSSPARRRTATLGVPFDDQYCKCLQSDDLNENAQLLDRPDKNDFLGEVIYRYGGRQDFYRNYYMNFVCPIGVVCKKDGKEVNANYYDTQELRVLLGKFIVDSLRKQIQLGDQSRCLLLHWFGCEL